MKLPGPDQLGLGYLASELLLNVTHRSRGEGVKQDQSTLRVLWMAIALSVTAGIYLAITNEFGAIRLGGWCRLLGLVFFAGGLALRWWSIIVLGRFFTVDVQIANDHQLVERGPFRWLRHPSYTGALMAFLGFGLSLGNWVSLLVILVPITLAFVRRMNVEEEALSKALGAPYLSYMARTKRLLPGVY